MEIHAATQGIIFVKMLGCGICFGLLYDFFRALRKIAPMNSFRVALTDLAFWIFFTVIAFVVLRMTSRGELRWYEFAGLLFGILGYFLLFGSMIAGWMAVLLRLCAGVMIFFLKILLFPVRIVLKPMRVAFKKATPLYRKIKFVLYVWREKCLFSHRQLKKILKSPKFF